MRLSKYEQKLLDEKRQALLEKQAIKSSLPPGLQKQIQEYPGRVVTVKCAQERLRTFPDMDLNSACTTPKMTPKPGSKRA